MTDQIAQIRITLDDIKPAIWRRVELPISNSLKTLHLAIQAVMLFENYHLFRFDDDYQDPPTREAGNLRLAKLIERGIATFTYTYDFGDDWRHSIVIEEVRPANPAIDYPRFVDGARHAPPEDVGGPPGFEEFLEAMAKPRHPEHKSVLQWYGRPFDPEDIGSHEIRARMAKLAKRRASGKAAHTINMAR
ncbi:plasmid pRiA4b ORF-3 family protein [Novosphingobium sp. FKTRR1]|uniref:plasmid pRiA4b ORF-3 family protein n=1 Tax=Novosphingobium sp. FKTRR1 TaxID=2879118 RepID=UPI001CF021CF|nr:plasmid pRiA4b ORF-3 family protein [Novosphingobium sp. FKTRR1]